MFSSFQNDIDFSFLMGLSQLPSVLEGGSGVGCTSFLILPIGPGLQSFSPAGGSPPLCCHPLPEGRMPRGSRGSAEPPCGTEWRNKSQDRRGRQRVASKLVRLRIPRTCDYIALHGKRDSVDVMKVKDPEMERLPWITQCPNLIT